MFKLFRMPLCVALVIILLDQLTKWLVASNVPLWTGREIIPGFFNLVHYLNKGAAFGFLSDSNGNWQIYLFGGIALLAGAIILHMLSRLPEREFWQRFFLGAILGGALGNLIDRLLIGEVIDFLDFYIGSFHWPAFNVADTAITCGVIGLLLTMWRNKEA